MKFFLLVLSLVASWASAEEKPAVKSVRIEFEGAEYRVIWLKSSQLSLVWKGGEGKPMRGFDKVQNYYAKRGRKCVFLMNAGIYEPGGIPSGLHVQNGKPLLPLNRKKGWGNFYLKPNGVGVSEKGIVFAITEKGTQVNLHAFSRLFIHLDCKNALFLDGDISRMEVRPKKKIRSHLFGAIFVVTEAMGEE